MTQARPQGGILRARVGILKSMPCAWLAGMLAAWLVDSTGQQHTNDHRTQSTVSLYVTYALIAARLCCLPSPPAGAAANGALYRNYTWLRHCGLTI